MNNFIAEHDYTEQKINELLCKEEEKKKHLLSELKSLPKGNLLIRKKNNDYFFSHKIEGQEKGIKRDKELIRRLARKCYIKKQIAQCETNSCALKAALDYIESSKNAKPKILYKSTYERMKTVFSPIEYSISEKEYQWISDPCEKNPFKPEYLRYKTKSGIMVRSKSERAIADKLTEYDIIYQYEIKLEVGGKVYYPDFTILTSDGKIVLWEHFGLMDNNDYFIKACSKIENYRKLGYVTHTNLICTYEDDMVSEDILESIIDRYLI